MEQSILPFPYGIFISIEIAFIFALHPPFPFRSFQQGFSSLGWSSPSLTSCRLGLCRDRRISPNLNFEASLMCLILSQ